MSRDEPRARGTRPAAEIPVLTEIADAAVAAGLGSAARTDELVAQIERAVIEELAPRLEDAVHEAVRAAVERALAAARPPDKKR